MPQDLSKYAQIVNHLEKLTETSLEQQCYNAKTEEVARLIQLEDSGRVNEKDIPRIAKNYRTWAINNIWPRYLRDVGVPLERRVRMSICYSRPVPLTMRNELKNNATEYDDEGRLCRVQIGVINWQGRYDDHKFNNIGDIRRRRA